MPFITPTGGLGYHLRALRHRRALWAPFREEVSRWLHMWISQPRGTLVIVGPSGGYTLDLAWVRRFDRIIAIEPDPIARKIFARRLKHPALSFHDRNFFTGAAEDLAPLGALLRENSPSALLFSNLLGQLPLALDPFPPSREWVAALQAALEGHPFASYHDRFSSHGGAPPPPAAMVKEPPPDGEGFARMLSAHEIEDHGTGGLFDGNLPREYCLWRLTPRQSHLVEFVWKSM